MKRNSSLWLAEMGTREGNQIVYRRAYIPAHLTDVRETFIREQKQRIDDIWEEAWINLMEEKYYINT
jgi:hypothetical protein